MGDIEVLERALLLAQLEMEVEQARLLASDQAGQSDQRLDVGQCVVGAVLFEPVGTGQVLQAKAWRGVLAQWPFDAVRAQRIAHARKVDQVPARTAVAPFALIRIVKIAVEQVPGEFVVESQRVVADAAGAGGRELFVHDRCELGLDAALALGLLRCNAGDQASFGVRQDIRRRLAVQHDRIANHLELEIGADAGELGRTIAARVGTGRLVVVPEESGLRHLAKGVLGAATC